MNTLESIKDWFKIAVPEPTDKSRCVQIGCHFEEVAEMIDAIGWATDDLQDISYVFKTVIGQADAVECLNMLNRNDLADALADQIVTAIGVAHMFGIDIEACLTEVNRSNYSKFVDGKPVFDSNGKIKKPESYSPPDLTKFV